MCVGWGRSLRGWPPPGGGGVGGGSLPRHGLRHLLASDRWLYLYGPPTTSSTPLVGSVPDRLVGYDLASWLGQLPLLVSCFLVVGWLGSVGPKPGLSGLTDHCQLSPAGRDAAERSARGELRGGPLTLLLERAGRVRPAVSLPPAASPTREAVIRHLCRRCLRNSLRNRRQRCQRNRRQRHGLWIFPCWNSRRRSSFYFLLLENGFSSTPFTAPTTSTVSSSCLPASEIRQRTSRKYVFGTISMHSQSEPGTSPSSTSCTLYPLPRSLLKSKNAIRYNHQFHNS
jgi:hypothetical protein